MTRVSASRNRARGASDEDYIAKSSGGKRHWANSGGKEDVEHPIFALQVKGGKRVLTSTVRDGVAAAKVAALGTGKLPVCAVVDRSGTRLQRYAVVPWEEFLDWHGCTEKESSE